MKGRSLLIAILVPTLFLVGFLLTLSSAAGPRGETVANGGTCVAIDPAISAAIVTGPVPVPPSGKIYHAVFPGSATVWGTEDAATLADLRSYRHYTDLT